MNKNNNKCFQVITIQNVEPFITNSYTGERVLAFNYYYADNADEAVEKAINGGLRLGFFQPFLLPRLSFKVRECA